ncbi:hypothetical protein [Methanosarcina sp. 1.H.T.1A.1]|uniref:hypothetical protein n=1 Tax=Methanosarcina sp. 1.H.T.1A.1 TaxID=1483602 RepID=UPI001F45CEC3|nr:hypothetical protein [Methanosarcina sp. 1.H.T.1A.1]
MTKKYLENSHFSLLRVIRQKALFFKADPDYGTRVAKGLGLDIKEVERLANMTKEERAKATEK